MPKVQSIDADDQHVDIRAAAGHELLEPLIAIEAYATLARDALTDGGDPIAIAEDLSAITRITARTRQLVERLLADAAPREAAMDPVSLNAVMVDALELLSAKTREHEADVEVHPLPHVHGDVVLLTSLFTNLLSNALTYGRRRGGRIVVDADRAGDEWHVFVTSEGVPIPDAEMETIFEPFRRGDADRRAGGHGVGLAICRRIAARHGGRVGVVPGSPAGNTFLVSFPA